MYYIGVDPGQSGGAAMLDSTDVVDVVVFGKMTDHDIAEAFREWAEDRQVVCVIEQVHAMPKQGVSSTFKFGRHYGFLMGCLTCLKIPFEFVTPNNWQKALHCQSRGDKNITKAAAQRLYPNCKITHATADALLIATYCKSKKL